MAGSGEVTMVFTADEAQAWRAIQKLTGQTQRLNDTLGQTAKKSKDAGASMRATDGIMQSGASTITSMIAGYMSLSTAIGFVTRTLEENKRVAIEAAQAQVRVASSQADALKNMTGLTSSARRKVFEDAIPQIMRETKFPSLDAATRMAGGVFSAPGTDQQRLDAMKVSASLNIHTPAGAEATAASLLDVAQATGLSNMQENAGFLMKAGEVNRVSLPTKIAQNLPPILSAAMAANKGADAKTTASEAAALFATLANATTDVEGDRSKTAAIQFENRLAKVFEKPKEFDEGTVNVGGLSKSAAAKKIKKERLEREAEIAMWERDIGKDPMSLSGRLAMAQGSRRVFDRLFKDDFGEEQFKPQFKELARSGSAQDAMFLESIGKVGFDSSIYDKAVADARSGTPQLALSTAYAQTTGSLDLAAQNTATGIRGFVLDKLPEVLKKTRPTGFRNLIAGMQESMPGTDDAVGGAMVVRGAFERLGAREGLLRERFFGGPAKDSELSNDAREAIQVIREFRNNLLEVLDKSNNQEMTAIAKDMRAASEALQRSAVPDYSARAEAERRQAEGR